MENLLEVSVAAALGFLASTIVEYFKPFMAERQRRESVRRLLYLDMLRITAYAEIQLKNPNGLPEVFPAELNPKSFGETAALLLNKKLLQAWYVHDYYSLKQSDIVNGNAFKSLSTAQYGAAFAALGNEGRAISDFYGVVEKCHDSAGLPELLQTFEKYSEHGPLLREYLERGKKELLLPILDDLFFSKVPALFRPVLRWSYIHFFGEEFPVTRYIARRARTVGVFLFRLAVAIIFVAVVSIIVITFAPNYLPDLRHLLK
jgi:hypothetical protein